MNTTVLCRGKWLVLCATEHSDAVGAVKPWEFVSRTGTGRAVAVIARLKNPERLVLVKQWRPPMNAWTLEFPAGLVEAGDALAATALRELEEETGFKGRVVYTGPEVCSSPGMTDETVGWMEVEIDGQVAAHPEDDERIEVLTVPTGELADTVDRLVAQGVRVEGKLFGYIRALAAAGQKNGR